MEHAMHPIAKKWCENNKFKQKSEIDKFYWDKDLDIGMTILIPELGTDKMKSETILSIDKEELVNDVIHITCVTLNGRLVIGYYNHNQEGKYISSDYVFEDEEQNIVICPNYIGCYEKDKSLILWINGDSYKKNDIYSLQRVCFLVQDID